MKHYTKQFIAGQWREGSGSKELVNYNPYTQKEIYRYRSAGLEDINLAFDAAYEAQKEWAKTSPVEKTNALEKLLLAVQESKENICACLSEEGGFIAHKNEFEYNASMKIIKECMRLPYMMEGKILPSNIPGKDNYVFRSPKGVITVIAPWNVPLVLAMRSVIPAIATGNAVVLKPASDTPASAFLIADIFEKAQMPKGLLSVVAGSGSDIGDALVTHPKTSLISFTGSTEVGRHIGQLATSKIKDVSLELGGNNAMIVLEDADLENAASAAIFGAFFNQGQVCMALNRIIIADSKYDEFTKIFVEKAGKLIVGDPSEHKTFLGPIINAEQIANITKLIEETKKAGAKLALEGKVEASLMWPYIFTEVTNDMPAAKNEVFGPVCCLIRAKSEEEAIEIANDTNYGLSGCVFTRDLYHGLQIAQQIDAGMVHVNDQSINDEAHVMFGGNKESGIGRFNAQWVMDKFTSEKWISVQNKPRF